jgi:Ca-activated chloride channel family protein
MNFLTPVYLALAGLAGPIILLYMLRLRRREVRVSSTLLWRRLMRDREANAPWQRLRRNLLLILQLIVLVALVLALARPFVPTPSVASGSVSVLLDASASMNATDVRPTRFAAAQREALALVNGLAADETMSVIAVGGTPEVLVSASGDRALLREAINSARPGQGPADWEAAFALAAAGAKGRQDYSIVIISDGGLPADLPPLPGELRYVRVGEGADNLAVSALAMRASGDALQLFAAVTNHGDAEAEAIFDIEADGALLTARRLDVPAGETASLTADLPPDTRVVRAALTPPVEQGADYLPLDDEAYAVYAPSGAARVLLVSDGNLFLEQALRALPSVEGYLASPGDLPEGHFDLYIFDGVPLPDELPDGDLLIVNPPASSELIGVGETFEETDFVRQADDSPIMAFVDFEGVSVLEARRVETPGWAQVLVEAEGGPLLLAGEQDGRRVAVLTFDLRASDLPLQIAFPVLMSNLMHWFAPGQAFDAPDGLRPGQPLIIRPLAETSEVAISMPDGSRERLTVEGLPIAFTDTGQLGLYGVELMGGEAVQSEGQFAVNLFSPAESNIHPSDSIMIGQTKVGQADETEALGQRELWPWVALAGLVVLLIEWYVYHRGGALLDVRREGVWGLGGRAR